MPVVKLVCIHFLCSFPSFVYPQKNKQQDGKSPQRRTAVTKEWQRDTNYGHNANHHSDVYQQMEQKYTYNTIAIHAAKDCGLSFRQRNKPEYEHGKKQENNG